MEEANLTPVPFEGKNSLVFNSDPKYFDKSTPSQKLPPTERNAETLVVLIWTTNVILKFQPNQTVALYTIALHKCMQVNKLKGILKLLFIYVCTTFL